MTMKQKPNANVIEHNKNLQAQVEHLTQRLQQALSERAMVSPPEIVASLTLHRTINDDVEFGRCNHAVQMLPNNAVLLLVTPEGDNKSASTFLINEESHGFTVEKTMIETPDETA